MNRSMIVALMFGATACSGRDLDVPNELVGTVSERLNGALSSQGFLTKKNIVASEEASRRADTDQYYDRVGADANGGGPSIRTQIGTLTAFKNKYEFNTGTQNSASYYNRGDLGLGRDMHCKITSRLETACYVTNYASGPDGSEFTFGFSPDIAFSNMDAQHDVATVAMVFRPSAPAENQIIFAVYDANENITNTAPLDRHGLNFFTAVQANGGTDPGTAGQPGVNFNNHIPSNCLNCHGGAYTPSSLAQPGKVTGAYFLPFDLDQFDYQNKAGKRRSEQEDQFRALNKLVRQIATRGNNPGHPIAAQIERWYGASIGGNLIGTFNSSAVPPGWDTNADREVYRQVIRPSCRGCHLASASLQFEDASTFPIALAANDLANHAMPHALQTQRLFWQSNQPSILATWFTAKQQPSAAATLRAAGPGNIVTLDPHLIAAATQ